MIAFNFYYCPLNMTAPGSMPFVYKLEPLNPAWQMTQITIASIALEGWSLEQALTKYALDALKQCHYTNVAPEQIEIVPMHMVFDKEEL